MAKRRRKGFQSDGNGVLQMLQSYIAFNERRWDEFMAENNRRWEENNRRWEENNRRWEENNRRWDQIQSVSAQILAPLRDMKSLQKSIFEKVQDVDRRVRRLEERSE